MKVVDTLPYKTNMCSETNSFVINVLNTDSVSQYVDTVCFFQNVCMYVQDWSFVITEILVQ